MYKVKDNGDFKIAEKLASEFDYNSKDGKIPLGVIYQVRAPVLAEKWPQLKGLLDRKVGWNGK